MSTSAQRRRRLISGACFALGTGTLMAISAVSSGYDRYDQGCQTCHGSFLGSTSPQGTIFPEQNKHQMHRSSLYMATKCNLCHTGSSFGTVYLGSSTGTALNPGVGCNGCHGHDYGGSIGANGAGLRKHHASAGVNVCANCHTSDPIPLGENVKPTYYGTTDTKCDDPCNSAPGFKENWSVGDTIGLDNDGDLLYDGADPDCQPCPEADLTGDCFIDAADVAVLLGSWGGTGAADLDGDGIVGAADLSIVLGGWGT